jgi:hypothetical protein
MKNGIGIPSQLSDHDLVAAVNSLARCEREATASLLAHLAEVDARRLYLAAGFSSLFTYCCTVLHLSEPAAYNRIEAARAARKFPIVLPMLSDGALSLATVRLLSSHLTAQNHKDLLAAAAGKSKREVSARDHGTCAFVSKSGRRCNERAFIDRGRDAGYPAPPAQIRACAASALGSCLR